MDNLRIQVLVAAMNQYDFSLIRKMNLETDVIVGNQCGENSVDTLEWDDHQVTYINSDGIGVGLNRNQALLKADADICLFADDDLTYKDGYANSVREAFRMCPDADAIIFNIETIGGSEGRRYNKKSRRIHFYNALNYGAVRIAVRRKSIVSRRICFSHCFGGGTLYSAGEDTLFICDMIKNGLKIYTSPAVIATVDQTSSTWFRGYNEKYLYDKGALFRAGFGAFYPILCLQELFRHRKKYENLNLTFGNKFKLMCRGAQSYHDLHGWEDYKKTW